MRIIFYGGRQAGMIVLLTLLSLREKVLCVVPEDDIVEKTARLLKLNIKEPKDINDRKFVNYLKSLKPDLFLCCRGRQILKKDIISIGCVNMHPCLYKYKGANPIDRLLADKENKASVGVHWMTEKVDEGKVIVEEFLQVSGKNVIEVYNELYFLYSKTLIKAIKKIKKIQKIENIKNWNPEDIDNKYHLG